MPMDNTVTDEAVIPLPSKRRRAPPKTPAESTDYERGREYGVLESRVSRHDIDIQAIGAKLDAQARDVAQKLTEQTAQIMAAMEARFAPLAQYIEDQRNSEKDKHVAAEERDKVMLEIKQAQAGQVAAQQVVSQQQQQLLDGRQRWLLPVLSALLGLLVGFVLWVLNVLGKTALQGPGLWLLGSLVAVIVLAVAGVLLFAFRPPRTT